MIRRGPRTSEFYGFIATLLLVWWLAHRGHSSTTLIGASLPGAAYAIGRSIVKAAPSYLIATFFRRLHMSEISDNLAGQVDSLADKSAALANLEPELGLALKALGALAEKAIVTNGATLLAKLLHTTPAAPAK